MHRSFLSFLLLVFITFGFSSSVWAWGQKGHRIVAQVAYQHLSKRATKRVDGVLGKHGMVYWANWPDEIKSDTELYQTSFSGHYQDLPGGLTDEAVLRTLTDYPTHGGNLWRLRDSVLQVLRTNDSDHDALVFLVHLTGDSYCPMHSGHEDDLGGNKVDLKSIKVPVLCACADRDHLVPLSNSEPFMDALGSKDKTFLHFPTGHIGMFTSSRSRKEIIPGIIDWLKERSK